jgi:hypothetical protein
MLCFSAAAIQNSVVSIKVKKGQIRSEPTFFGKIIAEAFYGDAVNVMEETEAWKKVSLPYKGIDGWMHGSALSNKRIILKPGESDVRLAATSDEVALAGKGFNKDIEDEYQKRNPRANFNLINKMEMREVSQVEIYAFLETGGLRVPGGDR